jgi:hypothetical protein
MMQVPAWLPHFLDWKPEDWAALGACVTALIAIIAALVAWRQVLEARQLRRQQAQPYVAVAMETSAAAQNMVDLVVKNFGTTAAYDVSVSIDPKPQRSGAAGGVEDVSVPKVFRTLVPGQESRTFWDSGPSRMQTDLPDRHEATVVFYSDHGRRRKRKRHELKYQLDFGDRKSTQYVKIYGMHEAAKALIDMAEEVRSWSEGRMHKACRYSCVMVKSMTSDAARRGQRPKGSTKNLYGKCCLMTGANHVSSAPAAPGYPWGGACCIDAG